MAISNYEITIILISTRLLMITIFKENKEKFKFKSDDCISCVAYRLAGATSVCRIGTNYNRPDHIPGSQIFGCQPKILAGSQNFCIAAKIF